MNMPNYNLVYQRWGYPASSCTYHTMGFILYRIRGLYVVRYYPSHTVFSSVGPDPLVTIGTRAFTLAAKRLLEWVCQCHIVSQFSMTFRVDGVSASYPQRRRSYATVDAD